MGTPGNKPELNQRGGTRIPCEVPVTLTSLNPREPFSERCVIILANLHGCAVRSPLPIRIGTKVRLEGLHATREVAAHVVNCISLGKFEHVWLLGLALEEAGNVWGLETVPKDWNEDESKGANWIEEYRRTEKKRKQA